MSAPNCVHSNVDTENGVRYCVDCGHELPPPKPKATLNELAETLVERMAELHADLIDYDRLAEAIVRRLPNSAVQGPEPEGLVDATTIARMIGLSRDWVYRHARELGGMRASDGAKPRWLFDPAHVRDVLGRRNGHGRQQPTPAPAPAPARRLPGRVELLPIKGKGA